MTYDLAGTKHVFTDWDLIEPGSGLARHDPSRREGIPGSPLMQPTREMPHGVRIAVHYPRIEPERLVEPDTPAEGAFICYVSIFEDDGLYRMYMMNTSYVGQELVHGRGGDAYKYMLAYAESSDGANWTKPNVGAVNWNGSTDNNLVYAGHAAPAFKDPSAPPDQRYKLVCMYTENGRSVLRGAVSADGLRFKTLEKPLLTDYQSDTHTVIRFDPDKGRYVGYFRGWSRGRRNIAYAETDRFDSWPVPEAIVTPDVLDHPDTDIYTNSHTLWPDADAQLMFPAFYERRLDVTEIHLMTSRDGLHWERPMRQPIIPVGEPGSGLEFSIYAGCELLNLRPGEWSLPISPRPVPHNQWFYRAELPVGTSDASDRGYVCLATWRQDGFTSLEAETEGSCATIPFTFSGNRLEVNAWSRFGGGMRVELADASTETRFSSSEAIAGRTFDDSDPISGDALKHTVTWNGESDLSAWAGKPIRLRFQLRRSRMHAFQFV